MLVARPSSTSCSNVLPSTALVNVMLKKRRGKRSGITSPQHEIDIVQDALFDGPPVYAKLCVDCQTARQRTSKAMSEDSCHNLPGSARIIVVQQSREHAP